jgi:hypothetical protein
MPDCVPAIGTHGIAQLVGTMPCTSGAVTRMRPSCMGSTFCSTVARYFP